MKRLRPGDIVVRRAMPSLLDAMRETSPGVWTVRLTCPDGVLRSFRTTQARGSLRDGLTPALRFAVLSRDGYTCRYCGRSAPEVPLHVDHIVPVAGGGPNDLDNLVTSCQDCNLGKGISAA